MSKEYSLNKQPDSRPVIMMIIGGLGVGGKEQQLISLLKGLKEKNNFSVVLAVMNPNGSRENEAKEFVDHFCVVNKITPFDFFNPMIQAIRIARKFKVTLVHTWGSGIWDCLGLGVARWLGIPFLHGGIRSAPTSLTFNNRVSKWCANRADAIVANSQAGLTAFGQESNLKARVIYNGIDLSRFEGIKPEPVQYDLCMVANFSNRKDHLTMVNSMSIISKAIPNARLLLVGHDAGTLKSTRMAVNQLGLDDSVIFVTDCLQPWQLVANSKVGVLATYREGISNAILEYFAFSKPVVASNNEGNSEVIISGKNGYLVDIQSVEALAEKAIFLLENPNVAEQMGIYGKEIVNSKFGMQRMIDSFESVYSGLIEGLENQK